MMNKFTTAKQYLSTRGSPNTGRFCPRPPCTYCTPARNTLFLELPILVTSLTYHVVLSVSWIGSRYESHHFYILPAHINCRRLDDVESLSTPPISNSFSRVTSCSTIHLSVPVLQITDLWTIGHLTSSVTFHHPRSFTDKCCRGW